MGLGTFLNNKIFGDPDQEERKRTQALALARTLIDEGLDVNTVNQAMTDMMKGNLKIPTERTQMLPPMADVDVPTRSTRVPIQFKSSEKKQKRIFTKDVGTGTYTYEDLPANIGDVETFTYNSKPEQPEASGENIYIRGGEVVMREPNGKKTDRVIKLDVAGAKGPKTPKELQDDVAKDVLKKYYALEAKGEKTDEIRDAAVTAAKRFGMSIDQIRHEPGFFEGLFGSEGTIEQKPSFTMPGTRANGTTPKFKSADEVKAAYKNKKISQDEAVAILENDFGIK